MKPKDALIKDGFPGVKAGRGRLSADAKKRLQELVNAGWVIDGYSTKTDSKGEKRIEKAPAPQGKVIADVHIPFPEDKFVAYERRDGKRHYRSMRSACNNCGVSLVACACFVAGMPARIVAENGKGSVTVFLDEKA